MMRGGRRADHSCPSTGTSTGISQKSKFMLDLTTFFAGLFSRNAARAEYQFLTILLDNGLGDFVHAMDVGPVHEPRTILVLGDGDFTFSLDLVTFLASEVDIHDTKSMHNQTHVIATGFDTLDELMGKYRDSPFVLGRIQKTGEGNEHITVTVRHCVNAIDGDQEMDKTNSRHYISPADRVIFNHPHLGTEDATLHSRFLHHLFHTVNKRWLAPGCGPLFHLTLAEGQFDRWKCLAAAKHHNFVLVDRTPFQAPPVSNPYYAFRRHQTGKAFHARTNGSSEIFTFARTENKTENTNSHYRPFWISADPVATPPPRPPRFECPVCGRSFKEERSVKSHVAAKHPKQKDRRKRLREDEFSCSHCDRKFCTQDAIRDHIIAKHTALHTDIKPDWHYDGSKTGIESETHAKSEEKSSLGRCQICGQLFETVSDRDCHLLSFAPTKENGDASTLHFLCSFCNKGFRERRAKLQHENVCVQRSAF